MSGPSTQTLALRQRSLTTLQSFAGPHLRVTYEDAVEQWPAHGFLLRTPDGLDVFGPVRYQVALAFLHGYIAGRIDALRADQGNP